MTVRQALIQAVALYSNPLPYQVYTPDLDARVLLAWVLSLSSASLLARYNETLADNDFDRFTSLWQRRLSGVPVAYLTGVREFYGREFYVDSRVLIPRPDTEILVEKVLHDIKETKTRILDCCTGSGCVALSLAAERPGWEIWASDISADALEVAKINENRLGPSSGLQKPIHWVHTDLLRGIDQTFRAIVANPPYLTDLESKVRTKNKWVEPQLALASGPDGLDHIRRLVREAKSLLLPGGELYIESASEQVSPIQALLTDAGYADIHSTPDLSGHFRITQGKR